MHALDVRIYICTVHPYVCRMSHGYVHLLTALNQIMGFSHDALSVSSFFIHLFSLSVFIHCDLVIINIWLSSSVFLLSPPHVADGCPSLSVVLPEVSSC